jgi:TPR repeat protein
MAQANLGACYYEGRGVSKDYYEAARWYRKAADQGIADVQVLLASMYASGRGVQKDRSEAIKWYRKAADQGHQMAKDKLRDMGVSQ